MLVIQWTLWWGVVYETRRMMPGRGPGIVANGSRVVSRRLPVG